jgi:hypothetical protein
MNGPNVTTYPDNPSWYRNNFENNKKNAFENFKQALSTISNKEEVIKLFGNKVSEIFGKSLHILNKKGSVDPFLLHVSFVKFW